MGGVQRGSGPSSKVSAIRRPGARSCETRRLPFQRRIGRAPARIPWRAEAGGVRLGPVVRVERPWAARVAANAVSRSASRPHRAAVLTAQPFFGGTCEPEWPGGVVGSGFFRPLPVPLRVWPGGALKPRCAQPCPRDVGAWGAAAGAGVTAAVTRSALCEEETFEAVAVALRDVQAIVRTGSVCRIGT